MAASASRPRNFAALPPSAKRRVAELLQDRIIAQVYYVARSTSSNDRQGGKGEASAAVSKNDKKPRSTWWSRRGFGGSAAE